MTFANNRNYYAKQYKQDRGGARAVVYLDEFELAWAALSPEEISVGFQSCYMLLLADRVFRTPISHPQVYEARALEAQHAAAQNRMALKQAKAGTATA